MSMCQKVFIKKKNVNYHRVSAINFNAIVNQQLHNITPTSGYCFKINGYTLELEACGMSKHMNIVVESVFLN